MARRRAESFGLKTQKKEKYVKRDNKPPTEEKFVPKVNKISKPSPEKSVEIFEGMTIAELAKRTGKSVAALQDILANVGEKCDSEFEPMSIDIAELVSMVLILPFLVLCCT